MTSQYFLRCNYRSLLHFCSGMKDFRLLIGFLIIYGCVLLFYSRSNTVLTRTLLSRNIWSFVESDKTLSMRVSSNTITLQDNTTSSMYICENRSQVTTQVQSTLPIKNYQFTPDIKGAVLLGSVHGGLTKRVHGTRFPFLKYMTWTI